MGFEIHVLALAGHLYSLNGWKQLIEIFDTQKALENTQVF